ncbi:MAG: glycosyltransferase family 8 protein [Veillonellaceae bacterium]|nr:glycosyltransferase family 8 protein [Veillonellaceae bacterium]
MSSERGQAPRVELAISLCDPQHTYAPNAAIMLSMALRHTAAAVRVHILHDETLVADDQARLARVVSNHGGEAIFHRVELPEEVRGLSSLRHITVGTLFRLFLPSVCADVDRILYLDIDVFVQMDLGELYAADLDGALAGVVLDVPQTRERDVAVRCYRRLGIDAAHYFNAGVLLLDCAAVRREMDLLGEGLHFLTVHRALLFADQDALNALFRGHVRFLDGRCNQQVDLAQPLPDGIFDMSAILHFSGYLKPWSCAQSDIVARTLEELARTPYGQAPEDVAAYAARIPASFDRRMDFKHCLLWRERGPAAFERVLCILKAVLPDATFRAVSAGLWHLRHRLRYDLPAPFGRNC